MVYRDFWPAGKFEFTQLDPMVAEKYLVVAVRAFLDTVLGFRLLIFKGKNGRQIRLTRFKYLEN